VVDFLDLSGAQMSRALTVGVALVGLGVAQSRAADHWQATSKSMTDLLGEGYRLVTVAAPSAQLRVFFLSKGASVAKCSEEQVLKNPACTASGREGRAEVRSAGVRSSAGDKDRVLQADEGEAVGRPIRLAGVAQVLFADEVGQERAWEDRWCQARGKTASTSSWARVGPYRLQCRCERQAEVKRRDSIAPDHLVRCRKPGT